jgi:hypothetical protein
MAELVLQRRRQQGHVNGVRQRKAVLHDKRTLMQAKLPDGRAVQRAKTPNNTGLPDNLKHGIESLSGMSMDNVKVHYKSSKPAQLNAHAYAQGADIHLAPGQEKHLPHEAWHVVQQAQGRVKPTMQMKTGVPVNDDKELEHEADVMGQRALQRHARGDNRTLPVLAGALQLTKKGAAVGALGLGAIGAGIGATVGSLGFSLGPLGVLTTGVGAFVGGAIAAVAGGLLGHHMTEPTDFAKGGTNTAINPDVVGEEDGGIRVVDPAEARPDDVPLMQGYRLAMHKVHNVALVLEEANKNDGKKMGKSSAAALNKKMSDIQKEAKNLAKTYKAEMRNLSNRARVAVLRDGYVKGLERLTLELNGVYAEEFFTLRRQGYKKMAGNIQTEGPSLWRTQWLKTKRAVDTAITGLWGTWKEALKLRAITNKGDNLPNSPVNIQNWRNQVNGENWRISYGGSLAKGYKGPPKQNTRFLASNFDVDANMDAPAIAEYLINVRHKTVDRGQLDPRGANTDIEQMDTAMDLAVKDGLVSAGIAPNLAAANSIVSEPFETRVNAPANIGHGANAEVTRSANEQAARDRLTSVRNTHPQLIPAIHRVLHGHGLLVNNSLTPNVLTAGQITTVNNELTNAGAP